MVLNIGSPPTPDETFFHFEGDESQLSYPSLSPLALVQWHIVTWPSCLTLSSEEMEEDPHLSNPPSLAWTAQVNPRGNLLSIFPEASYHDHEPHMIWIDSDDSSPVALMVWLAHGQRMISLVRTALMARLDQRVPIARVERMDFFATDLDFAKLTLDDLEVVTDGNTFFTAKGLSWIGAMTSSQITDFYISGYSYAREMCNPAK